MKIFWRILTVVIFLVSIFIYGGVLYEFTTKKNTAKFNILESERINFLLESTMIRIENKDPNLLGDLKIFSKESVISYEETNEAEFSILRRKVNKSLNSN